MSNAFGQFSQSSLYRSWKLACDDGGVTFFNSYRLRRTWATTLRAGRGDLADVQALIGNTSARTTERYPMATPAKLLRAAEVLGRAQASAREHVENEKREGTTGGADRVAGSLGRRKAAG
jgi:integrase